MKKNLFTVLFLSTLSISFFSCKEKAKEATTSEAEQVIETPSGVSYTTNLSASTIEWKGYKPTGSHYGTIDIKEGDLSLVDSKISGGSFVIDMTSLKDAEGSAKLEGHLKSADFFEVETYPTSTFEITSLKDENGKAMLSGNLTLKGTTNNVTFPVSVTHEGETLTLVSDMFTIDRSKWNVKYGSKSFFDDLGDKFINDDIELKVTVKATKS
ncbi:YceI family protein [Aestuariibaculum sp. YM273]|uniref:YceI family protein n=1 Tax=Aestuariibaculum sp. YM273 TaxID=3070659 RepID=UPI0027DCF11C|nr:YceI family protein [Aestuariibaculum sp. YM273]WMI65657.1 YceI family protein [Aestuariibaculum sp. YM273]